MGETHVGVALLIEYTAPVAVIAWLWMRHGQRPGRLTLVGASLAAVGLVLVLDLLSGADLSVVGVAWAPPACCRRGARDRADGRPDRRRGVRRHRGAWWLPLLALGVVTAALAYVTGIAASRRLGPRLASFVALAEVLFALVFAWLLLDELPRAVQVLGGVLILLGVAVAKLGERRTTLVSGRPGG